MMKHRFFIFLLCLLLIIGLTCCGEKESVAEPSVSSAVPEAFGAASIRDIPLEEAQTTALPASDTISAEPPQTLPDYTEATVTAAIICDAMDMLPYTQGDDQYLWRAVGYLAGQIGFDEALITREGELGKVSSETAAALAYAVDSSFSGQLPAVTEEDPLISKSEDGGYLINMLDQGQLTLEMTQDRLNASTETFTEEAELFLDNVSLGKYQVELRNYTGPMGGFFGYSIVSLSPIF